MPLISEELMKLGLAVLVGGLIGAEREYRDKSAGFRTMIFITLGSTLFTMLSIGIANDSPGRIAANIVTGIGFLGAGTIIREGGKVAGLTTAATIWLSASLGMGIGIGQYTMVLSATALSLVVLVIFPAFERWVETVHEVRTYYVTVGLDSNKLVTLDKLFLEHGIKITGKTQAKRTGQVVLALKTEGHTKKHAALVKTLIDDHEIIEFRY